LKLLLQNQCSRKWCRKWHASACPHLPLCTEIYLSQSYTRSSAVAERPRDASSLSVGRFNIQPVFYY